MNFALVGVLFAAALPQAKTSTASREVWAGHAVVIGHRNVPFLGKVEAKTSSFVIAEVTRVSATKFTLVQKSCAIDFENPTGVDLSLVSGAAHRLPAVTLEFERRGDGLFYQGPATSGWMREDVDDDGHPGMTIVVDAPICGGKIFSGVKTTNYARGALAAGGGGRMDGEMRARVEQTVIDTEGACLGVLLKSTDERVAGKFAYVPVAAGSTCKSFAKATWPVRVR